MQSTAAKIHDLLVEYQALNQKLITLVAEKAGEDVRPSCMQLVEPPVDDPMPGVPTLEAGFYQPMTAMLAERFRFASAWKNAAGGIEWLSLSQIEEAGRDETILNLISDRMKYWVDCPLVELPRYRVSLFGLYAIQGEEMYLIWPESGDGEPEILSYSGNYERRFSDFGTYLSAFVQEVRAL